MAVLEPKVETDLEEAPVVLVHLAIRQIYKPLWPLLVVKVVISVKIKYNSFCSSRCKRTEVAALVVLVTQVVLEPMALVVLVPMALVVLVPIVQPPLNLIN